MQLLLFLVMSLKIEVIKAVLLDLVSDHKHVLFGDYMTTNVRQKQKAWKAIHSEMVRRRLVNPKKDWEWTRRQWYYLTHLARKSHKLFIHNGIYDIPDFDRKLLAIIGTRVGFSEEETSSTMELLSTENNQDVCSFSKDLLEITENKFLSEEVERKEKLDMKEINFLSRKVNEQRFKLQQCELIKERAEVCKILEKRS